MKIRPFYMLFYIFLIAYILGNSPIPIYPTMIYYRFPFLGAILQAYIVCFGIFLIVKNYEQIKLYFSNGRSSVMNILLEKNNTMKTDLFRFIAISLLMTFFAEYVLTKIAEQPIISSIIEAIPGSDLIEKYVPSTYNATKVLSENTNFFNFGSIKTVIFLFPGLPIGTLVLFILRQLRYKSKKDQQNKYPGGTILLIFLIAVPISVALDISMIVQGIAPLWSPDRETSNNLSTISLSENQSTTVYGLRQFQEFSLRYLINPFYYVATVSAWMFDWYLFSRIWI